MSLPVLPEPTGASREEVLNQVISSIAMEELGLSHILNAEGEKLQYVLGTLTGITGLNPTIDQLLLINESMQQTINSAMQKEVFLNNKLTTALNTPSLTGPTGPTGAIIYPKPNIAKKRPKINISLLYHSVPLDNSETK